MSSSTDTNDVRVDGCLRYKVVQNKKNRNMTRRIGGGEKAWKLEMRV